jgi:hypothetical protein
LKFISEKKKKKRTKKGKETATVLIINLRYIKYIPKKSLKKTQKISY